VFAGRDGLDERRATDATLVLTSLAPKEIDAVEERLEKRRGVVNAAAERRAQRGASSFASKKKNRRPSSINVPMDHRPRDSDRDQTRNQNPQDGRSARPLPSGIRGDDLRRPVLLVMGRRRDVVFFDEVNTVFFDELAHDPPPKSLDGGNAGANEPFPNALVSWRLCS
jgi:hypothetical protein